MKKGFIFDHNLCVDCGACKAACILENGWNFQPRTIYKCSTGKNSVLSTINLSLACNHCEKPDCLNGCPSGAYIKDNDTGAVIVNVKRCIGCNYCRWNCPYDAPKSDPESGLIGKCNLCLPSLKEGYLPACASSCPVGALDYSLIKEENKRVWPEWFPDKKLDPAIELSVSDRSHDLEIIPAGIFDNDNSITLKAGKNITGEWSLIAFTFLTTLSVALLVSSCISTRLHDLLIIIPLILGAGSFSFFHLRKKTGAWMAVINFRTSPLSREIVFFLLFMSGSIWAVISGLNIILIVSSVFGLILLLIIDSVYTFSDKRLKIIFNSGQTFITGLLMASFFSGMKVSFLFLALIKIIYGIFNINHVRIHRGSLHFAARFLRIAIMVTLVACVFSGISFKDPLIICIFISGELIDRILFYIEFEPVNIKSVNFEYKRKNYQNH